MSDDAKSAALCPAGQVDAVLALAGDVAHGTGQRSWAPLTAFLAGRYAASREDAAEAIQAVRGLVGGLLDDHERAGSSASSAEEQRR